MIICRRAAELQLNESIKGAPVTATSGAVGKKIWIDLDNSPHVPFFLPIIEELKKIGHTVLLTARNSYQVCELLRFHDITCRVIGGHWGRNRALKIAGTVLRAGQLLTLIAREKPDLAVSHGSRAQVLVSSALGIPSISIVDYEFTAHTGFLKPDYIFLPQFIPNSVVHGKKKEILKYPGIKEDVYVPRFRPDPSLKEELQLNPNDLVVTIRPPASEAHYHNPEADVILDTVLRWLTDQPEVQIILLPRNDRQAKIFQKEWGSWIENGKIKVPARVVDGLNLIWFSDLVISGGGTMNREAAALGIPVYSIFRGRIGAVDRYLTESGRLTLVEDAEEVRTKILLERRKPVCRSYSQSSPALETILSGINSIAEHRCLQSRH
jgi:uncharacterized protein